MRHLPLALPLLLALPASAAEVTCPPRLTVKGEPAPPAGWAAYPGSRDHGLSGVTFVFGDRAAQMASASPATAAPDREIVRGRKVTQTWDFRDEKGNVFLICRYAGTAATLAVDLPRDARRCEITLDYDPRTGVPENPAKPPAMACR